MVGGQKKLNQKIKPNFRFIIQPNGGHEYFGEGGQGTRKNGA